MLDTPERQVERAIRDAVAKMPQSSRNLIDAHEKSLKSQIEAYGEEFALALAIVGASLAAE